LAPDIFIGKRDKKADAATFGDEILKQKTSMHRKQKQFSIPMPTRADKKYVSISFFMKTLKPKTDFSVSWCRKQANVFF